MPNLTAVIAEIQELQDQAAIKRSSFNALASWAMATSGRQNPHYDNMLKACDAEARAYARVLELLKEVDGGA